MSTSIVAVSYLNTTPFIYGIQHKLVDADFSLQLEHPAKCAELLLNSQADIGLVPVAIVPQLQNYEVITDFCIACNGKVDTVCLYSDVPLQDINTIILDYQSKTSVNLIRILASDLWKITPKWENATDNYIEKIRNNTAGLVIGDRAFQLQEKYIYTYDLGEEWKKMTGQPFVFACWVAKKNISKDILKQFNDALKYGIEQKQKLISQLNETSPFDVNRYLNHRILFTMDASKEQALQHFFKYLSTPTVNC